MMKYLILHAGIGIDKRGAERGGGGCHITDLEFRFVDKARGDLPVRLICMAGTWAGVGRNGKTVCPFCQVSDMADEGTSYDRKKSCSCLDGVDDEVI